MKYNISMSGDTLTIGFGDPAQNTEILKELAETLSSTAFPGGGIIKITGPASLPVAVAIAHHVCHLYGAVAVFDPKMGGYVVAVSHDPRYQVGGLID